MLLWVGFLFILKKTELKYLKTGTQGKRLHPPGEMSFKADKTYRGKADDKK